MGLGVCSWLTVDNTNLIFDFYCSQLFGEPDEDVSPDTADPELEGDKEFQEKKDGENFVQEARKSTREWAEETAYDADQLLNKFFKEDINYLLTMATLWKNRDRKAPIPLDLHNLPDSGRDSSLKLIAGIRAEKLPSHCEFYFPELCILFPNKIVA